MSNVDKVMASIKKNFGEKSIRYASELPENKVFPTKIPFLDYQLNGGIPVGKTTIIAGVENSWKTSLACQIGGEAQKLDIPVYLIDLEGHFDPKRAVLFGLDPDKAVIIRGEFTAEDVFKVGRDLLRAINAQKDKRGVIILDSIAGMITEALIEESASKNYGGSARVINQAVQVWQLICNYNQIIIEINQLRDTMVSMGEDKQMPGGLAQKYAASTIVWLRTGQTLKDGTSPIGQELKWTIKKSKTSQSKETGSSNVYYNTGFDFDTSLIETALAMDIFQAKGYYYNFMGQDIKGKDKLVSIVKENKDYMIELEKQVYSKMATNIWDGSLIDEDIENEK